MLNKDEMIHYVILCKYLYFLLKSTHCLLYYIGTKDYLSIVYTTYILKTKKKTNKHQRSIRVTIISFIRYRGSKKSHRAQTDRERQQA